MQPILTSPTSDIQSNTLIEHLRKTILNSDLLLDEIDEMLEDEYELQYEYVISEQEELERSAHRNFKNQFFNVDFVY